MSGATSPQVDAGRFAVASSTARFATTLVAERVHKRGVRADSSSVPLTDYDPYSPESLTDPYPAYARLLRDGPVHYSRRRNVWVISGYEAVRAALRADEVLSSAEGVNLFRIPIPMMLTLDRHPDQYDLIRQRPELIGAAIEEQLRFEAPIQGFHRTALRDYEYEGHLIPQDARVLILYPSANRDPAHYPNPDEFQIERGSPDHLSFGSGIHFCLGAYLSRLEARAALTQLVAQVSRIELAGTPVWTRNPSLRGLTHLPVNLISA
jgi:cytochrome P450